MSNDFLKIEIGEDLKFGRGKSSFELDASNFEFEQIEVTSFPSSVADKMIKSAFLNLKKGKLDREFLLDVAWVLDVKDDSPFNFESMCHEAELNVSFERKKMMQYIPQDVVERFNACTGE